MQKLQCELCMSLDIIKSDDGYFVCQHCGCKYTAEQARGMLSGVVEVVQGKAEFERLLQNAQTQHLRLKDTGKALQLFAQLTNDYPGEFRGWQQWLAVALNYLNDTGRLTLLDVWMGTPPWAFKLAGPDGVKLPDLKTVYEKALAVCDDPAARAELTRNWQSFWDTTAEKLLQGRYEITIGDSIMAPVVAAWANYLGTLSPKMAVAMEEGTANAALLQQARLGYDHRRVQGGDWREGWGPWVGDKSNGTIHFVLGRNLLWWRTDYDYPHMSYTAMPAPFQEEDVPQYADIAAKNAKAFLRQKGQCPSCNGAVDKGLLGAKCKKCGWHS